MVSNVCFANGTSLPFKNGFSRSARARLGDSSITIVTWLPAQRRIERAEQRLPARSYQDDLTGVQFRSVASKRFALGDHKRLKVVGDTGQVVKNVVQPHSDVIVLGQPDECVPDQRQLIENEGLTANVGDNPRRPSRPPSEAERPTTRCRPDQGARFDRAARLAPERATSGERTLLRMRRPPTTRPMSIIRPFGPAPAANDQTASWSPLLTRR